MGDPELGAQALPAAELRRAGRGAAGSLGAGQRRRGRPHAGPWHPDHPRAGRPPTHPPRPGDREAGRSTTVASTDPPGEGLPAWSAASGRASSPQGSPSAITAAWPVRHSARSPRRIGRPLDALGASVFRRLGRPLPGVPGRNRGLQVGADLRHDLLGAAPGRPPAALAAGLTVPAAGRWRRGDHHLVPGDLLINRDDHVSSEDRQEGTWLRRLAAVGGGSWRSQQPWSGRSSDRADPTATGSDHQIALLNSALAIPSGEGGLAVVRLVLAAMHRTATANSAGMIHPREPAVRLAASEAPNRYPRPPSPSPSTAIELDLPAGTFMGAVTDQADDSLLGSVQCRRA
jgi:hypothetical protein